MIKINSYDIDGVIYLGEHYDGIHPGPEDIIVTGRSYQVREMTLSMLRSRGIHNFVFFNQLSSTDPKYCRRSSGLHKVNVFRAMRSLGYNVACHFDDDPVQIEVIRKEIPEVKVFRVGEEVHDS